MQKTLEAALGTSEDIIQGMKPIGQYIGTCGHTVLRRLHRGDLPGGYQIGRKVYLSKSSYSAGIAARIAEASRRIV